MWTTTIRPRFCDTDAFGHINNTVIPVWFLEAREPVLRLFAPEGDMTAGGMAVVRIEVDYLDEIHFGQDVEVRTRVEHIGNSSFRLAQEAHQQGSCRARGRSTLVHFNPRTRQAESIPGEIRALLEEQKADEKPEQGC